MNSKFIARTVALLSLGVSAQALAQSAASDFTTGTRHDAMGRVTGTIAPDPDGSGGNLKHAAVRNTYDDAGRLTTVEKGELQAWKDEGVLPSGWGADFHLQQKVDTVYDAMGRKLRDTVSGWNGTAWVPAQVTQYSYDAVGRLECTALRMNSATWSSLPSSACTLATTGSHGPDRITKNVYDAAGQVLTVQKAYGVTTANGFAATLQQDYASYAYSDNGKQTSMTDANGNKAGFAYDAHDRQVKWSFPSKTTAGTVSTTDYEEYAYDANGNRTSLRKRDGNTIGYTYDVANRVTVKDIPGGTSADVYYGYDLTGAQTRARFVSISGAGITSAYDGFGRQVSSSTDMGGTTRTLTYRYDADGNRVRMTYPDSNYVSYYREGLGRIYYADLNGTTPLFWPPYGARGMPYALYRWAGGGWNNYTGYSYDSISRLILAGSAFTSTGYNVTSTFAYNPASQIVTRNRNNDAYAYAGYATASTAYAANGLNQYGTVGGASYTYDDNGNLTSDGTTTYAYDAENRLVSSSAGAALTYDPLGRLYKVTGTAGGGTDTRFLYDGDALVAEYNAAGTLQRRYVHGDGEDDPLVWYEGSGVSSPRYLYADHQGSVFAVTDSSGNVTNVNSYDEYGVPASGNVGRFQYTGQAWIPEIGMYHYKARIYDPKIGRFLQTDPVGYKDQVNLYAYAGNDPANSRDPSGLYNCFEKECAKIGRAIKLINKAADAWDKKNGGKSEEGTRLRSFISSLGTENDGNKVDIYNSKLPDGMPGKEFKENGRYKIELDFNQNKNLGNLAATLVHETVHYMDDKRGLIYDAPSEYASEYRAYFWGAIAAFGYNWYVPGIPNLGGQGSGSRFIQQLKRAAHTSCIVADQMAFTENNRYLGGQCP